LDANSASSSRVVRPPGRWVSDDPQLLRALVDTVMGPVLEYDASHSGLLVPSVRTWLEHDRRTMDASAALHVHPNTLAYRIRRFEQLSGRSLSSTADLAEVWLALHAVVHTHQ
jgi:purine catabolism regulator